MKEISFYQDCSNAEKYNNYHSGHLLLLEILKMNTKLTPSYKIADIGCGTGNETILMDINFPCRLVGIDSSLPMLGIAMMNSSSVEWKYGYAENIPLENNSVDIITSFFSIHHFKDIDLAFDEFERVLKKNGKVFIFTISHREMINCMEYRFFPDLLAIDINRIPSIEKIKMKLNFKGFDVHIIEEVYEKRILDKRYYEQVKTKYRSGLMLLSDEKFKEGLERVASNIKEEEIIDEIKCSILIADMRKKPLAKQA